MLNALFRPRQELRAQVTTWGDWGGGGLQVAGMTVDQTTAMQLLAVSGCVRYISDTISTLPIDVYQTRPDGTVVEDVVPAWVKNPSVDDDNIATVSQITTSLLLHGNAYIVVTRKGAQILELRTINPTLIRVANHKGRRIFTVNGNEYPGEILHVKGMMLPGTDVGLSPLEYARQSIGLGLAALDYGQDSMQSGNNMPGVIELPGSAQPEIMKAMGENWRRQRTGKRNRGLPGVLESGAVFKPTGVTNEQAQFLQTRQWTAAEICGQVFLVDPTELGIPVTGTSIQYGNMEQRQIATTRRALQPWMIRIEKAFDGLLGFNRHVKFNLDGLLRADSTARWANYEKASVINTQAAAIGQPPVLTTTEMRDFEDLGKVTS